MTVAHWIADKGIIYVLTLSVVSVMLVSNYNYYSQEPNVHQKYIAETDLASVVTWKADRHQPLVHLALMSNNLEVLDSLLHDYDFDVHITDTYGCTAMMRAATGHNPFQSHKSYDIILRCAIYESMSIR